MTAIIAAPPRPYPHAALRLTADSIPDGRWVLGYWPHLLITGCHVETAQGWFATRRARQLDAHGNCIGTYFQAQIFSNLAHFFSGKAPTFWVETEEYARDRRFGDAVARQENRSVHGSLNSHAQ